MHSLRSCLVGNRDLKQTAMAMSGYHSTGLDCSDHCITLQYRTLHIVQTHLTQCTRPSGLARELSDNKNCYTLGQT